MSSMTTSCDIAFVAKSARKMNDSRLMLFMVLCFFCFFALVDEMYKYTFLLKGAQRYCNCTNVQGLKSDKISAMMLKYVNCTKKISLCNAYKVQCLFLLCGVA